MSTFGSLEKLKNTFLIVTLQATDINDEQVYHYMAIRPIDLKRLNDNTSEAKDLSKYGIILHSGMGTPTEESKRYMKEKFGYDTDAPLSYISIDPAVLRQVIEEQEKG